MKTNELWMKSASNESILGAHYHLGQLQGDVHASFGLINRLIDVEWQVSRNG